MKKKCIGCKFVVDDYITTVNNKIIDISAIKGTSNRLESICDGHDDSCSYKIADDKSDLPIGMLHECPFVNGCPYNYPDTDGCHCFIILRDRI